MRRAEHLRAGSPSDVVLDDEVPRIHVRLRTDPDVVADDRRAVEASLNVGLGADEDAVADLEGLEMLEPGAAADLQAVSASACGGSPDATAHHDVNRPLTRGESRIELDECRRAVRGSQRV